MRNGWFRDSYRHSLAARGIKTSFKAKWKSLPENILPANLKYKLFKSKEADEETGFDGKFRGLVKKELGSPIEDSRNDGKSVTITLENGNEYLVFDTYDDAEKEAISRMEEDIDNDPGLFSAGFLENYIDEDRLREALDSDVTDSERDYVSDQSDEDLEEILEKAGLLDIDDIKEELDDLQNNMDNEENNAKVREIKNRISELDQERRDKIEEAKEEYIENIVDEKLQDPIEYLKEIYTEEEAIKHAIEWGGINSREAAEAAVRDDGVASKLAGYDGEEVEINGKYLYRVN